MATLAAMAKKSSEATDRIFAAANGIAKELGVEPLVLPLYQRNPDMLRADQLTAIADYLETIHGALSPKSEVKTAEIKAQKPVAKKKG